MDKLPNEIVYQIIAHLGTRSLSRISQVSKHFNALVGDRIYSRAIEQDKVDPGWPLSLTLAAAHNQPHAFKRLLDYSTVDHINSDIIHKNIMREHPRLWHMLVREEPDFALPPPKRVEMMSLLHVLTLLNREDTVRMLLEKLRQFPYPPTGYFFPANDTLPQLAMATVKGRIRIVKMLTEARPDLLEASATAAGGSANLAGGPVIWHLLNLAISMGQIGIFDYLVDIGADFLTRHWEEICTELILTAMECEQLQAATRLFAMNLQGNGARDGLLRREPRAFGGSAPMERLFDDEIEDMDIDFAIHEQEAELCELLLEDGGNPLHYGPRPLEDVKFLLDLSPELVNSRDDDNLTPLDTVYADPMIPDESEVEEFVECLIAAGGRVSDVNPITGQNPLHDAIYCLHMKVFEALLRAQSQQALIDSGLPQNTTALQITETASRQHTFFLAHSLVKADGNKHVVYDGGSNLMHIAAFLGQPKFVSYLLKQRVCASLRGMVYDFTPLHTAVYQAMKTHKIVMGYANMMGLIILGDLTVTARDVGGGLELEQLSDTGYMEVVRLLVASGVDVSCEADGYGTALDIIACERIFSKSGPLFAGREAMGLNGAGQSVMFRAALVHWILAPRQDTQEDDSAGSFLDWYDSRASRSYDITKWARKRRNEAIDEAIDSTYQGAPSP
ncbi:hypothetical protein FQN55_007937 [Onygenales sp. PD_40]|nr:hypothetical protein FQN55_007937 [Onygenales sp. PD_40]